ncbi:cobyrinate a,c-diamide synthase [Cytobacillus sp. Hz8]|uniref:cobyrinate a,c-diamide synthase n=1 Tax=Cytobacillus sp. Hz8 TaxID=3347168 RepID=UPI0035DA71EE
MSARRMVIAGTGSGVGKTSLTIGIMVALQQKGYKVQGFKCGPDYIDPSYHTAVTGRVSRNLDSWMCSKDTVRDIVSRSSFGADISIIEGVMGFYDGKSPLENTGSTAEISLITESPVVLIVNCASMARSAAAIVKGFQSLAEETNIVAVIANQVGSSGHFEIVKAAIEQECHVPVIGYLLNESDIEILSRHLGLIPAIERGELGLFFEQLGTLISGTIDIDLLYKLAKTTTLARGSDCIFESHQDKGVQIAVAKDEAFNFYYQENLDLLEAYGAKLVYFSPLKGESVPSAAAGLYIGGGFPEEFAKELSEKKAVKASIYEAVTKGMPTLAECGGFMYLTESIQCTNGKEYPMVGFIPGRVIMQKQLAALGYREIAGVKGNFLLDENETAKGHEFHYSVFEGGEMLPPAYQTKTRFEGKKEGYLKGNLVAGYSHIHFASNPKLAENWVKACVDYAKNGEKHD